MTRSWPKWRVRWCVAFSTITTAWSTRMPIEIAMPASDMMFDDIPKSRIMQEAEQDRQRQRDATTNALRRCIRISRIAIVQTISSSFTVPVTVSMRLVDQPRAVVERDDPHALGQARPGARDLLLDPVA